MMQQLKQFSAKIGNDISLTQGPGGNVSLKQNSILHVKASGTWLADAQDENIFACLDLESLKRDFCADQLQDLSSYLVDNSELRPSIETLMHAYLPHPIVVHVHAIDILAYAVQQDGQAQLEKKLQSVYWHWVPYVKPGLNLAKAIARQMDNGEQKKTDVFVLANHGLLIGADSVDEAQSLISKIIKLCEKQPRISSNVGMVAAEQTVPHGTLPCHDSVINNLAFDATSLTLLQQGCLYPDQVIFLGGYNPVVENDVLNNYLNDDINQPYIVVPNIGVFLSKQISKGAVAQLKGHAMLLQRLTLDDSIRWLNQSEMDELLQWDAEKYRQSIEK